MTNSVRLAWPTDAALISGIQRRGWQQKYPAEIWKLLCQQVNLDQMQSSWRRAIQAAPLAQQRVLVASDSRNKVAGFAVVGPSPDADSDPECGAIVEFWIDPMQQNLGHGSRLMQAAIDTLRADGFQLVTWWLLSTDDALRQFAQSAGWEADGAHQELGLDENHRIRQIRLHVNI